MFLLGLSWNHIYSVDGMAYPLNDMDDITEYKDEGFDLQRLFRIPRRVEEKMKKLPFTKDVRVMDVGYFPVSSGHLVERSEGLKSTVLIFCMSGKGWFSIEGKKREVKPMEVVCIPAGVAHTYGSNPQEPWKIYWVHAEGDLVDDLLSWTPLTVGQPKSSFVKAYALQRYFHAIFSRLELGYSDHTLLELSRFFINVVSLLHVDSSEFGQLEQKERIEQSMCEMRQSLSHPLTLKEYAQKAGFSQSQFSFLFNKYYGTSPMSYFTELRVQRARELLAFTSMSVKEVAAEIGFDDPLYFSRIFKKVSGLSPSSYKSMQTNG